MSFGENLKNIRKQKGITQEELADIVCFKTGNFQMGINNGYPETEKLC